MSLIRVLQIPQHSGYYLFGRGEEQTWIEVDWFRDDDMAEMTRDVWEAAITLFIQKKRYFNEDKPLLVLGEKWSFCIHYSARPKGSQR